MLLDAEGLLDETTIEKIHWKIRDVCRECEVEVRDILTQELFDRQPQSAITDSAPLADSSTGRRLEIFRRFSEEVHTSLNTEMDAVRERIIAVTGLGYVGLPLVHAFARRGYKTYGYDISSKRISELKSGIDRTGELTPAQLKEAPIIFSDDPKTLQEADIVILALPTPVDEKNKPDLSLLESATHTVGRNLKQGAIVVYESTVYPGVTEEICVPILEKSSGMKCGMDFKVGYSPERINPGDKERTIDRIVKIVAGQDRETLETLSIVYGSVVTAGIHKAPSIKVAEMAKAVENAQRDVNIAFMNEIATLCHQVGISIRDVLDAAGTKWNFLRFTPGLVGGHCIGVDPYYLIEKAAQLGTHTDLISAARTLNDSMSGYVAKQITDALPVSADKAKLLVLGLTFKEDVPDIRNSKAMSVAKKLQETGASVSVHDPHISPEEMSVQGLIPGSLLANTYHGVALLVPHRSYRSLPIEQVLSATTADGLVYDLKSVLDKRRVESAGRKYASL
ncbi:MAG: nucleotide sugar dehydrogenase [Candidatus Peregrinibacteria bacterium]|nr:nucleotide sugar dehydrogenase [Candidatus Peregrinibacteria bacterium]